MKKNDNRFLPIAEQYIKYQNKHDLFNMDKLEERYIISFKSVFNDNYMIIGNERFLCDYNNKTHKYFIKEVTKIENIGVRFTEEIENRMNKF